MDKCIKADIPTGKGWREILMKSEDGVNYFPIDGYKFPDVPDYFYKCNYCEGSVTTKWAGPFKVIAQYGDEFPV